MIDPIAEARRRKAAGEFLTQRQQRLLLRPEERPPTPFASTRSESVQGGKIRVKRVQVGPDYLLATAYAFEHRGRFYATDAPSTVEIKFFVRTGRLPLFGVVEVKSWADAVERAKQMALRLAHLRGAEIASWEGATFGPEEQLR